MALLESAPTVMPVTTPCVLAFPFYFCADRHRGIVTRKVFHHYRNIADQFGFTVVGVGSEGSVSRDLWCEWFDEVNYREYPQTWNTSSAAGCEGLRSKFDETVRAARHLNPDRVFIGGSDDLLPAAFFTAALQSDADLVGVGGGATIVRLAHREVYDWDGRYTWAPDLELCGGGVVMSRRLLDRWRWAPFTLAGDEVGLERRAKADGFTVEAVKCGFYAVKTEKAVLNGWKQVSRVNPTRASVEAHRTFKALWALL